jgi:hypothetical protein
MALAVENMAAPSLITGAVAGKMMVAEMIAMKDGVGITTTAGDMDVTTTGTIIGRMAAEDGRLKKMLNRLPADFVSGFFIERLKRPMRRFQKQCLPLTMFCRHWKSSSFAACNNRILANSQLVKMHTMKIIFYLLLKTFIYSTIYFVIMQPASAQDIPSVPGVYHLTGVMETASVFELKPDSSFDFFFSQGALDRGGRGKWHMKSGHIILNSTSARPPKDYAMVNSKTVPGHQTIIKMVDKNTMILSYSDISLKTPAGIISGKTNSGGEARFNQQKATAISLLFRLCPDRESVFNVDPKHNYFEFRLEPWIAEIFFRDFSLQWKAGELSGAHPLLEGNEFRYTKDE